MSRKGRAVLDELRVKQGLDPKLPWGGRSPRALAEAAVELRLTQRAATLNSVSDEDARLEEQYRRFLNGS
jgi:hypothetical protein